MSTDLDTRLRELSELSPPSHDQLGAEELRHRAGKRRQRTMILRAVPAVVVVIALVAGAVALRDSAATTDVIAGQPDATDQPGVTSLSDSDQKVLTYLVAAAELRHEVEREAVLTVVWSGSNGINGGAELQTQRAATDAALARYRDEAAAFAAEPTISWDGATVQAPDGTAFDAAENAAVVERQLQNRLELLDNDRRAADTFQSAPPDTATAFSNISGNLAELPEAYLPAADDPELASAIQSAGRFGNAAAATTAAAGWLTAPVEVGFYAMWYYNPSGPPILMRGDCGDDPSAAGATGGCWEYSNAVELAARADELAAEFDGSATDAQHEIARASAAGPYDDLQQAALDGGDGRNDLGGGAGSPAVDPSAWRAAALERIDQMADAQRQLYELAGTPGG